jgi:uncharacterized glyoxalase superfamily protein PhnB
MAASPAKENRSCVIPAIRYNDARAAIAWLERALGFTVQAVYDGEDGSVAHAQLVFGGGMIMVSSYTGQSEWAKYMVQPDEIGMRSTSTLCLIVTDAEAVYHLAKEAGAEIINDLAEMSYGGKAFGCRDLEGHAWSIGEYDPWA